MSQITLRDKSVLYFLQKFTVAKTSQISAICFDGKDTIARRRLNALVGAGFVRRESHEMGKEYVYWIDKKPRRISHSLVITDIYVKLSALPGSLEEFLVEPDFQGLHPDAYCKYTNETQTYYACFDVERLTGNMLNQKKYEDYYNAGTWKNVSPAFPTVIIVTDNEQVRLAKSEIRYVLVSTDLHQLSQIFK